jgi:hypothetical protein
MKESSKKIGRSRRGSGMKESGRMKWSTTR